MQPSSYNAAIHHRRSIRLKGYDYSQAGLYFITICVQHRKCLFGEIENGTLMLNDAGHMVEKWYHELRNKFPDIHCDEHVVMPNHFHCIIENTGSAVGANLRVRPTDIDPPNPSEDISPETISSHIRGKNENRHGGNDENNLGEHAGLELGEHAGLELGEPAGSELGEHTGSPLRHIIQWFKTMTTNEYIRGVKNLDWQPFDGKLWQRNYYEHIIRNEQSYNNIRKYIVNNPAQWQADGFNPVNRKAQQ